jgi:hypothetical protein
MEAATGGFRRFIAPSFHFFLSDKDLSETPPAESLLILKEHCFLHNRGSAG